MWILRKLFDKAAPHFEKGGKLHGLYPLFEVIDTFFFTPPKGTEGSCHVRDTLDFKRMMMVVVYALIPCTLMAMYNTGYQANHVMAVMETSGELPSATGWRAPCFDLLNRWGESCFGSRFLYDPANILGCFLHGAFYFLPVYIVTLIVGGFWEVLFAIVRKHEVNEGFLVTGLLFPLTLPPTIPLWQVACGISFGVVLGKEVFGGTGRNWLNPALAGRAYLFFAHAGQISGNTVWTAVDGYSGATPLSAATASDGGAVALATSHFTWLDSFLGFIPGSMGETSTLACLFGAAVLIFTGVASWRIMASMTAGALGMACLFNWLGSGTNAAFSIAPHWHFVLGGFAFGAVFMATDPISSAMTKTGQCLYGLFIGVLILIVRVLNPAFPEGTMLAILLGNVVAPLMDYYVVKRHIAKRTARATAK
ncbi:MAG: NADH:ubiquinone reductase (Na(+)-transporting) subunit B [Planctomycetaceae bacterium]|jgi:Na+-transporting NADH:ubiquinone oxidoreductase subunit B|nr:NADH:ubiquinone reductase (Na(+)-transporting) subunit B [Planctomycetaceae bacterium]